ncbi:Vacuolar fusion protein mon1 [Puccinia graminis f. sp. tritici]|uniref:Vacuolar fusion protein mon1 n=1 Tax=Puccinia graminis f. sp. tritici TaxID=56615 RepID=A0A5B0QIE8_PUCGR|nr:Vacuolar fusion protein mon1 [Puccinia graminis f. sp. tritici]
MVDILGDGRGTLSREIVHRCLPVPARLFARSGGSQEQPLRKPRTHKPARSNQHSEQTTQPRRHYSLPSAGKPVWSAEKEDEDRPDGDLTSQMGLIQAVISI